MPTILRLDGFRFLIYQGDAEHAPAHVHAIKAGQMVVIDLTTVSVRDIQGMGRTDVRAAVRITGDNLALLVSAWRRINGNR